MRLLLVCTGNLCRSPLAERLMRSWAVRELGAAAEGFRIESAGTAAARGPMDERTALTLRELGGDPDGGVARQLRRGETADVDLVLTMTREHRHAVLQYDPRALRRVFTLAEASALLSTIDRTGLHLLAGSERARELAARLDTARARRSGGVDDDIPDPVGRPLEVHREVAMRIAEELRPLADVLFGTVSAPPLPRRPSSLA